MWSKPKFKESFQRSIFFHTNACFPAAEYCWRASHGDGNRTCLQSALFHLCFSFACNFRRHIWVSEASFAYWKCRSVGCVIVLSSSPLHKPLDLSSVFSLLLLHCELFRVKTVLGSITSLFWSMWWHEAWSWRSWHVTPDEPEHVSSLSALL